MDNADIFRYILTNKVFPDKETNKYEFKFKTVFNKIGSSYRCCRCAYDHEYFTYISESREIDTEKFDRLTKALKDGHCQHTTNVYDKRYINTTKVTNFHIAAALILGDLQESWIARAGIFQLCPYEIAVLKGNVKFESKGHGEDVKIMWQYLLKHTKLIKITEKENDVLRLEEIPLYELYIMKGNVQSTKMLFDTLGPAILKNMCEYLFKNDLTCTLEKILFSLWVEVEDTNNRCQIFETVESITRLAIIYNVQSIFEMSIQISSQLMLQLCTTVRKRNTQALFGACRAFQRQSFEQILNDKLLKEPPGVPSNFFCLYNLLIDYPLSAVNIKNAMTHIPDIERIINIPFAKNENNVFFQCEGLNPLQIYLANCSTIEVPAVRALIDLGADIDVILPYAFFVEKPFGRCLGRTDLSIIDVTTFGQSLFMYILEDQNRFSRVFKELFELFLYENVSLDMNTSAVATCLKKYKDHICDRRHARYYYTRHDETFPASGTYIMDVAIHEIPVYSTIQLLIEAGFQYLYADIDELLHSDYVKEREQSICAHEAVLEYLNRCVSDPRSLQLRCRDVLRRHFPKRQIHKFVSCVEIPSRMRDFLLLKPILQTLKFDSEVDYLHV